MQKSKDNLWVKYRSTCKVLALTLALSASHTIVAQPFSPCPNEAFLIQDTVATLYGVKLSIR